jgi:hypothetical protein
MAPYAAFAAAIANKAELLDQILTDQHEALALANLDDVFQAFRDAMDGKAIDAQQFLAFSGTRNAPTVWNALLLAYFDAKHGTSRYHHLLTECFYENPINRLLWIAQDNYQRRDPSFDGPAFYTYLAWFYDYDPWVNRAVADFHARGGTDRLVDPGRLRADLRQGLRLGPASMNPAKMDWYHAPTPWRVAACVHQLLIQSNHQDAVEIAQMYKDYESMGSTYNGSRHSLACEILHKATLWKLTN